MRNHDDSSVSIMSEMNCCGYFVFAVYQQKHDFTCVLLSTCNQATAHKLFTSASLQGKFFLVKIDYKQIRFLYI